MSNNNKKPKLGTKFQYIFENIESYTQIIIGNQFIPEIDKNIILCIPTFIINGTGRKHRFYVEYYQKNYGNIYYFNEMTYYGGIWCKHVNMNHLPKYKLDMFPYPKHMNFFCKIINLRDVINERRQKIKNFDDKYSGIFIEYDDINKNLDIFFCTSHYKHNSFLHSENADIHCWFFYINEIIDKQIWIAYNKPISKTKSARK